MSDPNTTIKGAGPAWETNYETLVAFQRENNHTNVPTHGPLRYIAKWCARLRASKASLHQDQIQALDDIGFDWVTRKEKEDMKWEEMFQRFTRYKEEKDSCLVPQDYAEDPELGTWVANQRRRSKQGKVRDDRAQKLASLGFVWKARELQKQKNVKPGKYDDMWVEMFEKLRQFKEEHGHCNVPYNFQDKSLAMWVSTQRRVNRKKTFMYGDDKEMRPERRELLASIGFDFNFGYTRKEKFNQQSSNDDHDHDVGTDVNMDVHFPETLLEGAIMDAIDSKPTDIPGLPEHELILYETTSADPNSGTPSKDVSQEVKVKAWI